MFTLCITRDNHVLLSMAVVMPLFAQHQHYLMKVLALHSLLLLLEVLALEPYWSVLLGLLYVFNISLSHPSPLISPLYCSATTVHKVDNRVALLVSPQVTPLVILMFHLNAQLMSISHITLRHHRCRHHRCHSIATTNSFSLSHIRECDCFYIHPTAGNTTTCELAGTLVTQDTATILTSLFTCLYSNNCSMYVYPLLYYTHLY